MLSLIFFVLATNSGLTAAASPAVETVSVSVRSDIAPLPARVAKRLELSVATVGEHILIGRRADEIEANKAAYENLIREVFDRVLVGYSVQEVDIIPAAAAQVTIVITPWGDTVRDVAVETDFGGVSPAAAGLIQQDMSKIRDLLINNLVGIPVDAVDWAGSVSKTMVRETLADQLPEFRLSLDIVPGQVTTVKLSLIPVGPLIQDVEVTFRARNLPNLLLLDTHPAVEDAATVLRGLPVAFVERHSAYFTELLRTAAARHSVAKRFGLTLSVNLNTGTNTQVIIGAETTKYNISLESYLDIGRTTDNTSVRLHIGKYFGKADELFLETTFIPATVAWEFMPGWGHRIADGTEGGLKYYTSDKNVVLWLNQDLGRNWMLRLERTPGTGRDELGIRYRLHDFLSVEYIFTRGDKWLRLIGNL